MASLISRRGKVACENTDFLNEFISLCFADKFDEKDNPKGMINMGTAVNSLCQDLVFPQITSPDIWSCNTSLLDYEAFHGILRLRKALANLLTELFETSEPVSPDNLFCVSGVSSCIDVIAHCLADPGDVFLVPTPVYGCIYTDLLERAQVDMYPIPIISENCEEEHPVLTLEKVAKAYEKAQTQGKNVRGLLLLTPSNPLGDVYTPELLMEILLFCKTNSLHVVMDEIYGLSVFKGSQKFHSVLKFPKLPDPERTHVLYGLSKDFALTGLRIGLIHTTCKPLQKCLIELSIYQNIPFPVMEITAKYLENLEWIKNFVAVNQQRLAEKYKYCVDFLTKIGLKVRLSSACFFLWIDLRDVCKSFEQEMDLFEHLFKKAKVYVGPGKEFFCAQPGWFRVVFTRTDVELKEGLERLARGCREFKQLHE